MPDMILLQGAITGLKTAADIAIGLNKLHTLAEVQGKAVELQQVILAAQSSALSAQSEQFALVERIRDLEKQIAQMKAWEETKQRYELREVVAGVFVYALKETERKPSEPSHWICAKCYEDAKRAIVQIKTRGYQQDTYICFECDNQFVIPSGKKPPPRYANSE